MGGGAALWGVSVAAVDQTVASVGPYSLTSRTAGSWRWCSVTSSAGQASPATMTARRLARSAGAANSSSSR